MKAPRVLLLPVWCISGYYIGRSILENPPIGISIALAWCWLAWQIETLIKRQT
jgi:hypothetical protein